MKYAVVICVLAFLATAMLRCSGPAKERGHEQAKALFTKGLADFAAATTALYATLQSEPPTRWQAAFKAARFAYKEIELFTDYYFTSTAKAINGPPVTEVEADDLTKEVAPTGFQVMEEGLYPTPDTTARPMLLQQARVLQSLARRLQNGLDALVLTDSHLFDALRLQVLRITTIGLAGADNGTSGLGIAEAAVSLATVRAYSRIYADDDTLSQLINNAVVAMRHASFEEYDRGAFLLQVARPLWHRLHLLQQRAAIRFLADETFINTTAPELFGKNFFNTSSFSPATAQKVPPGLQAIGKRLFSDTRLSGNGQRSCASCHQPARQYANHTALDMSVDEGRPVFRNTPTIRYAALQPLQFADGRLSFLEDQAQAVIENHSEMRGHLPTIARQLAADTGYRRLAARVLQKQNLDRADITAALAAFVRTQAPFTSAFDRFLAGDAAALSATARRGYNLFMGKAKCGTCHFMPLFNGVVPPHFNRMDSEVIGVPAAAQPLQLDKDEGRFRFTGAATHRFAFKTPTLRNSAGTAPYMHNGVFKTLDEVMDFYNDGGGAGQGLSVPGQTLPAEKLGLTAAEKEAVIAFLKTLSDE